MGMMKGDCYEAAGKFIMDNGRGEFADDLVLVHAEINGRAKLDGITLGHAWIENLSTGLAIDASNDRFVVLPIDAYRKLAGVDGLGNEYRYTFEEFQMKVLDTEHWGPWDLHTDQ